jgi:hypothetical protein
MQFQFDASRVAPMEAFELLPKGWYTGAVVDTKDKETNGATGPGRALDVTIEIMGGDWNKRKLFDSLNLVNNNPQAVDIAYRTLSAICHATGVIQIQQDTSEVHGKPMLIQVGIDPQRKDAKTGAVYEARNKISGYKAIDPNAPPVLGPPRMAPGNVIGSGQPAQVPNWVQPGAQQSLQAGQVLQAAPQGWAGANQANPNQQAQPQQPQYQQPATQQAQQPVYQQPAQQQPVTAAPPPAWAQPQGQQPQNFAPAQGFQQPQGQQQPATQQVQQPAAQAQQPQVQQPAGPGGTPPWQQPGQPGAAAPGTPPWLANQAGQGAAA